MTILSCGKHQVDLSTPRVMGVLNVTPDSFSDGGQFNRLDAAVSRAMVMAAEGVAIIDVGGESTRPGSMLVSEQEELDRVIPVIEALVQHVDVPVSIDTSKSAVMRAAVTAGAEMINDVCALQEPGALDAVVDCAVPVCLMHMQGKPKTMQLSPHFDDVLQDVFNFLLARVDVCIDAGISRERIILDPGFGFGKTLIHNQLLLKHLDYFSTLGFPVLVGMSQKSMIGEMLGGAAVGDRTEGSVAAAVIAAWQGASIVRVHDVRATVDALKIVSAIALIK